MGRFITYALIFIGSIIGVAVMPHQVGATRTAQWLDTPITKFSERPSVPTASDTKTCAGTPGLIELRGDTSFKAACIFGDTSSLRLARYRGHNNEFIYSVAFASDTRFAPVSGLCTGMAQCAYGKTGDTLLLHAPVLQDKYTHVLIKDFSKYLIKSSDPTSEYRFEYPGEYMHLRAGEQYISTRSVEVSSSGRWAIFELPEYGFIRLDLKTMEYKRFAAYDSLSTHVSQPLESTISEDGKWVAVVGMVMGILIYEVNDICGDTLVSSSSQYFTSGSIVCNSSFVNPSALFSGFQSAHAPRFSFDARKLHLDVRTSGGYVSATVLGGEAEVHAPFYMALGDSFTSGEGETDDAFYIPATNSATNRCHVSNRSYPYLIAESRQITALNLACSGARIAGVQNASRNYINSLNQGEPAFISFGIGGNDIGLMGKLKSCLGVDTCEWAKKENRLASHDEIKNLLPNITSLINELKATFSSKPVFVIGYPDVINDQPDAQCSAFVALMLNTEERRYMRESIKYLNTVLRIAAQYANSNYINLEDAYQGERLCDESEAAMNGVRYGDDIAPIPMLETVKFIGAESFHPTPRGHQLAAAAINPKINNSWQLTPCTSCLLSSSELAPSSYWLEGGAIEALPFRQFAGTFLSIDTVIHKTSAAYSFLPGTFKPGSTVKFELHSNLYELGSEIVDDDGSLRGTLELPDSITGYHTVHAYGETYSSEALDIYQTLYVDSRTNDTSEQSVGALTTNSPKANKTSDALIAAEDHYKSLAFTDSKDATDVLGDTQSKTTLIQKNAHTEDQGVPMILLWWAGGIFGSMLATGLVWVFLVRRKHKSLPLRAKR